MDDAQPFPPVHETTDPRFILSQRQMQIVRLMEQNKLFREIALELGLSKNTVTIHVQRIYEKLGVTSRAELILRLRAPNLKRGQLPEPLNALSGREMQLLYYFALEDGKKMEEIASLLGIGTRTVNAHATHIYKKLGVRNRAEAINLLQASLLYAERMQLEQEAEEREGSSEAMRQANLINRHIAREGPIPANQKGQPGKIQLVFYDQKGFHVAFKPPGRAVRQIVRYTKEQWQALLNHLPQEAF